jgi:hypothetical protein
MNGKWIVGNYTNEKLGINNCGTVAILCDGEVIALDVSPEHAQLIVDGVNEYIKKKNTNEVVNDLNSFWEGKEW